MNVPFDSHPKLMPAVASASVISTGLGTMYFMAILGFLQNWILIIAPTAAAAVAGVFLYAGRHRRKSATESEIIEQLNIPITSDGSPIKTPAIPEMRAITPETKATVDTEQQSQTKAVGRLMQELETKIEQRGITIPVDTLPQIGLAETPSEGSLTVVDQSRQRIAKKREQRCIVIVAPSHGVLQDRLNNWLSGGYGAVISISFAMNDKGFYLTVFYEPLRD